jgi:hypothetical protein
MQTDTLGQLLFKTVPINALMPLIMDSAMRTRDNVRVKKCPAADIARA